MENLFEDFIRKSRWRQHQMNQERRMRDLESLMRRFAERDEDDDEGEDEYEEEEDDDDEYHEIDIEFRPMA